MRVSLTRCFLAFALLASLFVAGPTAMVEAQTPGASGKTVTNIHSNGFDLATDMAVQADGKIIAVGPSETNLTLVRYNTNGSLDTAFGAGSKVSTGIYANDIIEPKGSVALQADGKIVVAAGRSDFVVARYNSDGSPDDAFGIDGRTITDIPSRYVDFGVHDIANDVAVQSDGKIIVAGESDNAFALARYDVDGSLDTSFNADGIAVTNLTSRRDAAWAVEIQPDGSIIAAGEADQDWALVRYNPNGDLDTNFGVNGIVTTTFGNCCAHATDLAVQSDGHIVATGFTNTAAFGVVRYESDGSPDTTFGIDGVVTTKIDVSSADRSTAVALQSDENIVIAGWTTGRPGEPPGFMVARYTSAGILDTTFDTDGISIIGVSNHFPYDSVSAELQPDGKIVIAGEIDSDFTLLRLNSNGSLDTTFAVAGIATTNVSPVSSDAAGDILLQLDGKLIAVGHSRQRHRDSDLAAVRYNMDGSLDTTFGMDGIAKSIGARVDVALVYNTPSQISAAAVQSDNRIIVAAPGGSGFILVRFNSDGSLDTTFGRDGMVEPPIAGVDFGNAYLSDSIAMALQSDGKIVVASGETSFVIARFNTDGSIDNTFGTDGVTITDIDPNARDLAKDLVILPDNRIVVVGEKGNSFAGETFLGPEFAIVRYTEGGRLDLSFGDMGIVTTSPFTDTHGVQIGSGASAVVVQPDGKLVVAGGHFAFALARYDADGNLDPTFGIGGLSISSQYSGQSNGDFLRDITLQSDGKIVATGGADDFIVARFHTDGRPDSSFGENGVATMDICTASGDYAYALVMQTDGKIVVAGDSDRDFAVVRLRADGSFDTTFGSAEFPRGTLCAPMTMALHEDTDAPSEEVPTTYAARPGAVPSLAFRDSRAVWGAASGATSYMVRLWDGSKGRNVSGLECCEYVIDSSAGITHFTVQAINDVGRGPWASWVKTKRPPGFPEGLQVVAHGSNQFRASWSPPSDSGSAPISSYEVRYSRPALTDHPIHGDKDAWSSLERVAGTSHVSGGRLEGVTYTISVSAVNADGLRSPVIATAASIGTTASPGSPTGLRVTSDEPKNLRVTWSPPRNSGSAPIASYEIQYSRPALTGHPVHGDREEFSSRVFRVAGTSHGVHRLLEGVTYTVHVTAVNGHNARSAAGIAQATVSAESLPTEDIAESDCPTPATGDKFETERTGGLGGLFKSTRVVALQDFTTVNGEQVRTDDEGGKVSSSDNLSQEGCSWIFSDAQVTGNAQVLGDAVVTDKAHVYGNATVCGNAVISGDAQVYGNATVSGNVTMDFMSHVFEEAILVTHHSRIEVQGAIDRNTIDSLCDNTRATTDGTGGRPDIRLNGSPSVHGDAVLIAHGSGTIEIRNQAEVYNNAIIDSYDYKGVDVWDKAKVHGDARVCDGSKFTSTMEAAERTDERSCDFNGKIEMVREGRNFYRELFEEFHRSYTFCGYSDAVKETRKLLGKNFHDREAALNLLVECERIKALREIVEIFRASWWELMFEVSLDLLGVARLGAFLESVVHIAHTWQIFDVATDLNRLQETVKHAAEVATEIMEELEKCGQFCEP